MIIVFDVSIVEILRLLGVTFRQKSMKARHRLDVVSRRGR